MSADEIYQRLQGLKLFGMAALCDELLGLGSDRCRHRSSGLDG